MQHYRKWIFPVLACVLVASCNQPREETGNSRDATQPLFDSPYAVGSSTFFIHDQTRPYDSVAGVNTGVRSLITEIWYPVDRSVTNDGDLRRATYGDYVFGDRQVHQLMMTETTFFHLTPDTVREGVTAEQIDAAIDELFIRQRQSWVDAPLANSSKAFPVVVMTHGDAGSRYNMETVSEYLAAHGYVVIAPEHTGNSPYSMTGSDPALAEENGDPAFRAAMAQVLPLLSENGTYGSREQYGQSYSPLSDPENPVAALQQLDKALLQRLNDLRATLDTLDKMNESGRFAGRLALDRIGLIGRSFGGTTTLVGLAMEPRFTAGFSVVPMAVADHRAQLPPQALVPTGQESVVLAADGGYLFASLNKPTFILSCTEDGLIIRGGQQQATMAGTEQPSKQNPYPALRNIVENSNQPVAFGMLADANHATLGISGGYWWPQLKPQTAKRALEPNSEFELMDVSIAHRIQRDKALAFFDLTIRQDAAAREALLDDGYTEEGLTLKTQNM